MSPPPAPVSSHGDTFDVRVPDIGDFKDVPVIEVLVKPGDAVKAEDPLITLGIGQGDPGRAGARWAGGAGTQGPGG